MQLRTFVWGEWAMIVGLFFSSFAAQAQSHADPLFSKMAGLWFGKGERIHFSETGLPVRRTPVEVEVESAVESDRLVSMNFYREGAPAESGYREYERTYWIRWDAKSSTATARAYVLGGGRGEPQNGVPARGGSQGTLTGTSLQVVQALPGEPPIHVLGETEFIDSETTVYRETITWGDRLLTRSQIRYVRQSTDLP